MSAPSIATATVDLVVDFAPMIRALREAADRLEAASSSSAAPVEPVEPEAAPVEEAEAEDPEPEVHYLRDRDGDVWEVQPDGSASWTHYSSGARRSRHLGGFRDLANGIPTHLHPRGHPVRLTDQEVEALQ